MGFAIVELFNPVEGNQLYVFPETGDEPIEVEFVLTVQIDLSGPAFATGTEELTVINISSEELEHNGLLIVQRKVLEPVPNPVTPEVGLDGLVNTAVPETTDHKPVPVVGVLPARVVVLEQIF
jgi:hypothetical protein